MACARWYARTMNRLWTWLKTVIENHPITFVVIGGTATYLVGLAIVVVSMSKVFPAPRLEGAWLGITFGSFLIVSFHWLVARYDRRSVLAQILALVPATFLFVCVVVGAGLIGVMHQSCSVDAATGEIRACQEGWQFVWEPD